MNASGEAVSKLYGFYKIAPQEILVVHDELDLPLTFEAVREAKTTLGSGVVMVFDDTVDMHAILLRIAQFFRNESCGQCVPCRVGTVRQQEALARLANGTPRILVAGSSGSRRDIALGDTRPSTLRIMPYMMQPGDEKIASEAIHRILANPPKARARNSVVRVPIRPRISCSARSMLRWSTKAVSD